MAATQVARNTSFNGFDEFVNMPGSPSFTPCPRVAPASAASTTTPAAFNMRKIGLDEKQPPPPPGSSPEALFRYYLAVELRKAGTQPEEALLDRYVRNHFDSLFKNKGSATASTSQHANASQPLADSVKQVRSPARASDASGESPPELYSAESPAYSGSNYTPLSTPPALAAIAEKGDNLHDMSPSIATGSTVKFETDAEQNLSFFRTSPFRMIDSELATIDPHFVEKASSSGAIARSMSTVPSQDGAPMSEDGGSDEDDDETKQDFERHLRDSETPDASFSRSSLLNEIPMAIGSINYLKPDPEEYKKLSSKEKRQLRNKISARNFRTRRKEYITLLEEQISDRDNIIEGLRQQLALMSTENKSLKEEVRVVKTRTISSQDVGKILEALQNMTPLQTTLTSAPPASGRWSPPNGSSSADYATGPATPSAFVNFGDSSRPSTPTVAVSASPRSNSPRPSMLRRSSPSIMPQANTKKDVAAQSSFWGGVGSANAGSSFMPVC